MTCGNEILLAGIQYYSRKWIITRGKIYYSRERIITRGNLFITRGNDILLAGEKYWQYMAPEGFRRNVRKCFGVIKQQNESFRNMQTRVAEGMRILTQGQFWPLRIVVAPVCVSMCPSVTKFVRAISHEPFKLGSPNLIQRCKTNCLRSLWFCGTFDLDLQGQIELLSQNLPHF